MAVNCDSKVSVVIPVYNEADILVQQLDKLLNEISSITKNYELVIVENGSQDQTKILLEEYSKSIPEIRTWFYKKPDYGGAMKYGIIHASGPIVHVCQLDYFDVGFFKRSLSMISNGVPFVIGSRNRRGWDGRPAYRIILTFGLNCILKTFFNFSGTDTHGLKTFIGERVIGFIHQCKMTKGMFDTEFTLRAQYSGMEIEEIPVKAYEIRETRNYYFVKIFRNIKDLAIMRYYFYKEGVL